MTWIKNAIIALIRQAGLGVKEPPLLNIRQ